MHTTCIALHVVPRSAVPADPAIVETSPVSVRINKMALSSTLSAWRPDCHILTSKDGPRTERINKFILAVDT